MYDIPPVERLAMKYLDSVLPSSYLTNKVRVRPVIGNNSDYEIDLLISNYALSELEENVRMQYVHTLISRARYGYITWNEYDTEWLLDTLEKYNKSNIAVREEWPQTSISNCIITWGPPSAGGLLVAK